MLIHIAQLRQLKPLDAISAVGDLGWKWDFEVLEQLVRCQHPTCFTEKLSKPGAFGADFVHSVRAAFQNEQLNSWHYFESREIMIMLG